MVANGGGEGLPGGPEFRRNLWVNPDGVERGRVEVQSEDGVEAEALEQVDRRDDAGGPAGCGGEGGIDRQAGVGEAPVGEELDVVGSDRVALVRGGAGAQPPVEGDALRGEGPVG